MRQRCFFRFALLLLGALHGTCSADATPVVLISLQHDQMTYHDGNTSTFTIRLVTDVTGEPRQRWHLDVIFPASGKGVFLDVTSTSDPLTWTVTTPPLSHLEQNDLLVVASLEGKVIADEMQSLEQVLNARAQSFQRQSQETEGAELLKTLNALVLNQHQIESVRNIVRQNRLVMGEKTDHLNVIP